MFAESVCLSSKMLTRRLQRWWRGLKAVEFANVVLALRRLRRKAATRIQGAARVWRFGRVIAAAREARRIAGERGAFWAARAGHSAKRRADALLLKSAMSGPERMLQLSTMPRRGLQRSRQR